MRIGVLDSPASWVFREMERVAGDVHEMVAIQFSQLSAGLDGSGTSLFCSSESSERREWLDSLDAILIRPMPSGSLQQVVFRMNLLQQLSQQHRVVILNPPPTIESSVDKYLCLEKIRGGKIEVPATFLAESAATALLHFRQLAMDTVIKPLFGSGGNGIERVQEIAVASKLFSQKVENGEIIYQQQFIDHGDTDLRLLVIGDRVLGMQRTHAGHWITNIQQGQGPVTIHQHPLKSRLPAWQLLDWEPKLQAST